MTTIPAQRLARIFVEVADTLVDEFDLIDFLQMLVTRAAELINNSTAGLLLSDQHNELRFMAASDENTRSLELFQAQNKQGPCLDAFRTGRPVVNIDLEHGSTLWPLFAPTAAAAGFRTVHAFPLRLRREVIGALNIFGSTTGMAFDDADTQIMQALADVAAIALLQERSIHHSELLTEQLQGALNSRIIIEQAKGVLANTHHTTPDQAFTLLRDYARRGNHRLLDIAITVVTDLTQLPELATPRQP